jgi:hypothetical protein
MAPVTKAEFLSAFSASLIEGSAAFFVGAGLSRARGFVDWRGLLEAIAKDLHLDIARETDLLALAQYHENSRGGRAGINAVLIEEFNKDTVLGENHRLIASLPVRSIWTTNYDALIEEAYRDARKRLDVKTTPANLAQTLPHRDATLYKMHGDKSQPQDAILTKGDYETYNEKRGAFSTVLQAELIERTFLFLGFSFTDPNIDYILARVRGLLREHQRDHYCLMKWPDAPKPGSPAAALADYEYEKRKLDLRIADLRRYHIQAVMIDSYSEITEILEALDRLAHSKDVLVSGSAMDYNPLGQTRIEGFLRTLGAELVRRGFRLVSGYGLGIGSSVAFGALSEIHSNLAPPDKAMLMPFPQKVPLGVDRAAFYTSHREQLVRASGFVVFVCGNREVAGVPENAPGVLEEFALAARLGRVPIPIGASGWMAAHVLAQVRMDLKRYYGEANVAAELDTLNDRRSSDEAYLDAIFAIIKKVRPLSK